MTDNTRDSDRAEAREPLAADFIVPLLASGLAIYYLVDTTDLVWEARAAGVAVGVPLLALCIFHMGRTVWHIAKGQGSFSAGDLFADTLFNRQRLALGLLIAVFIAALPWTGTTLGLFLVLTAALWTLGVRSIRILLTIAATTSAVVYILLMYLVGSRLPHGPVEWLITWTFGIGA